MKDSVDLKTYYLIILPAVVLIAIALLTKGFTYKIQFAFFIVIISLISLSVITYFEKKGQQEALQSNAKDDVEETPAKEVDEQSVFVEESEENRAPEELTEELNVAEMNSEEIFQNEIEEPQLIKEEASSVDNEAEGK